MEGSTSGDHSSDEWELVVRPKKRKSATRVLPHASQIVPLRFDCSRGVGDYKVFMKNLREQLTFARHERLDRPLLAKFRPDNPARWMHVKLVSDNHEATLAIRDDTVYLIGFQARKGTCCRPRPSQAATAGRLWPRRAFGPGNPQQTPPSTASQGGRGHLQQQKSSSASHGGRGHHQQQKQKQLSGTGRHGQPLVEVFSVRANFPVVGTIAVFDGKRGQIIYDSQNDLTQAEAPGHGGKDDLFDLVLSGPSRVISADGGSFAIKFDPCESDSDDSIIQLDKDNNLWELECIANDDEYCVLESSITTGLGRTAEVTYAVLNNAVEATIEATLFLSRDTTQGTTHIDGKISAHIPLFSHDDSASVLLFSKAKGKKTDPEIRDARSIPIPLARSVVAMPLCSSLTIKVSLHATTLMHDEEGSTSTSGDASTSTTPAEDHFEHSFDMHLGETCSLSVEGVGKLCICLDIPCSEYKEEPFQRKHTELTKNEGTRRGKETSGLAAPDVWGIDWLTV
ncbi:hypothetical protein ZWY2020_006947 [Hordeum vulgare]|nr:hypothetical protein ZWY2020_006947 [Hordeum vulgare]